MSRDPLDCVRPEIRAVAAYHFSPPSEGVRAKLDFNEAPADPPEAVKAAVLARLGGRPFRRYPELGSGTLRRALAAHAGVSPDEVLVGNGSGELVQAAVSVLAGGGGTLVLSSPVFSLYDQIAAIAGARLVKVPLRPPAYDVDEEGLRAQCGGGRTVPLLCSPSNPTGGTVSRDLVRRLAAVAPVVLADQAYVDFAEAEDDLSPLLGELPNLVVFRTLSKAYAVAGLRIGFALTSAPLAREIGKAILPFNVDVGAETVALAVLSERETFAGRSREVARERERVARGLRALGAEVAPSRANFLFFVPPGADGEGVFSRLAARGVLVRDLSRVSPGALRVSIGTPEENDLFLTTLEEVL